VNRFRAHPQASIFVVALGLRLLAGYLFFGSVDVANSMAGSLTLVDGKPYALPYFPLINALIWFGGMLATWLPVPLALAVKLGPILFDSLLAVLIHDLVAPDSVSNQALGFRAGMLYASSPLALLNVSFHGQWDAMALFFLILAFSLRAERSRRAEFLFGGLFACSLLVKPIALPFLLLFVRRGERRPSWASSGGFALVGLVACGIAQFYGYAPLDILVRVASYSSRGVQIFGLPFAPLLSGIPLLRFRLLWMAPAAIAIAVHYYRGRFRWTEAMLLFYLCSLATAGLSPQYLLWPLPFLLLSERWRLAAIYSAVATAFLLLFYANPWASFVPFENLTTFIPVRSLPWLAAPSSMMAKEWLPVLRWLGNVLVPVTALMVGLRVLVPLKNSEGRGEGLVVSKLRTAWYVAPGLLIAALIWLTKVWITVAPVRELARILEWQPRLYAMHLYSRNPLIYVADDHQTSAFHIVFLLAGLALAWSAAAAGCGAVSRNAAKPASTVEVEAPNPILG
jgi:hypothetical protein